MFQSEELRDVQSTRRRESYLKDSFKSGQIMWRESSVLRLMLRLGRVAEDQSIEVGIIAERIQIMIVLSAYAQVRLQVECSLKRFQSQIN